MLRTPYKFSKSYLQVVWKPALENAMSQSRLRAIVYHIHTWCVASYMFSKKLDIFTSIHMTVLRFQSPGIKI